MCMVKTSLVKKKHIGKTPVFGIQKNMSHFYGVGYIYEFMFATKALPSFVIFSISSWGSRRQHTHSPRKCAWSHCWDQVPNSNLPVGKMVSSIFQFKLAIDELKPFKLSNYIKLPSSGPCTKFAIPQIEADMQQNPVPIDPHFTIPLLRMFGSNPK